MAAGFCRNRGCPRGRRARRLSRLRRRRRRPRWRWWPCSSPSRPWCRSGIAGTPSCRRRTASRRGVRRGSSSSAAFSAAKLSRVHETSASASATSATRNTGARVIPDLRTRAGQPPALLMTEQTRLTDARSAPRWSRGEVLLAGDGAAVDADGAGDAHRHLDRADHVLDGGLGGLRGEAVVPRPRRATRRTAIRRAVGAPRRRCRRRRALRVRGGGGRPPERGLRGTRRLSCVRRFPRRP